MNITNLNGSLPENRSMPASTVIPVLRYAEVRAAVDWLCRAFGCIERLQIGSHRAQLSMGNGDFVVATLNAVHGVGPDLETPPVAAADARHALLVRVDDVDQHCDRARAAGARIVQAPATFPFGERQYSVEDLGGHHWTFSQTIANVDPATWGGTVRE
jgi:uncharacterized glyoxalase superfamily protein PhnB